MIIMTTWDMTFGALPGIDLIQAGADLAAVITDDAAADRFTLADGDVIVVAQKIVSKAEGRVVNLADVVPTDRRSGSSPASATWKVPTATRTCPPRPLP